MIKYLGFTNGYGFFFQVLVDGGIYKCYIPLVCGNAENPATLVNTDKKEFYSSMYFSFYLFT